MRRPLVLAVYVAVAAIWGSTWLVIRLGLRDLPPLLFAGVRMATAALLLSPLALRRGGLRALLRARRPVAAVGLLQVAIPYGLMFVAQQWVPSGLSAVLFATFPVWIALAARLCVPGERLTPARLCSAALGMAGVAVLEAPRLGHLSGSGGLVLGSALIVLASIVVAFANLLARRQLSGLSPLALTAGQSAVGGVLLLLASLLAERGRGVAVTPAAVAAVLYLAVFGSGLTYVGLYWLLPRVPLAAVGLLPLLDTTVAVLLGAAVLGEPLGATFLAGAALVLAAAALAGLPRPRPRAPHPESLGPGAPGAAPRRLTPGAAAASAAPGPSRAR